MEKNNLKKLEDKPNKNSQLVMKINFRMRKDCWSREGKTQKVVWNKAWTRRNQDEDVSGRNFSKKSAAMNKQRIAKMAARSKHVESSFKDSKNDLAEFIKKNPSEYKELLKKLICQGLIKLMEG